MERYSRRLVIRLKALEITKAGNRAIGMERISDGTHSREDSPCWRSRALSPSAGRFVENATGVAGHLVGGGGAGRDKEGSRDHGHHARCSP